MTAKMGGFLIVLFSVILILFIAFIQECARIFVRCFKEAKNTNRRMALLEHAEPYLSEYTDIWRYQKLLSGELLAELKVEVIYIEDSSRIAKIKGKKDDIDKVWNYILEHFSENATYEDLIFAANSWYIGRLNSLELYEKHKTVRAAKVKKENPQKVKKQRTMKLSKKIKEQKERTVDL